MRETFGIFLLSILTMLVLACDVDDNEPKERTYNEQVRVLNDNLESVDFDIGMLGHVDESCASRCKHECGGLDVASCFLNCSNHGCHPSCCGCKDGGPACEGCGASCNTSLGECSVDPDRDLLNDLQDAIEIVEGTKQ